MSQRPEQDRATADQADEAANPAPTAQSMKAPLIRTDARPAAGRKGRGTAARSSPRKTTSAFDAAAINRMVDNPSAKPDSAESDSAESDSPQPDSAVAPPDAPAKPAEVQIAERGSPAVATEKPAEETAAAPGEAAAGDPAAGDAAHDLPVEPDLPVVTAGGRAKTRAKPQSTARVAGGSRHVKYRRSRSRTPGWIVFGVCGVAALSVVVLLVNRGDRPAGGAAAPRGERQASSPQDDSAFPQLPDFKIGEPSRTGADSTEVKSNPPTADTAVRSPQARSKPTTAGAGARSPDVKADEFLSRTGVRPLDDADKARLRKQTDSFAEMG